MLSINTSTFKRKKLLTSISCFLTKCRAVFQQFFGFFQAGFKLFLWTQRGAGHYFRFEEVALQTCHCCFNLCLVFGFGPVQVTCWFTCIVVCRHTSLIPWSRSHSDRRSAGTQLLSDFTVFGSSSIMLPLLLLVLLAGCSLTAAQTGENTRSYLDLKST